ncbi:growth/differentiation factor 2 [Hemicordylus capensis]|uniref:growth/differentiation factor 2 n=1 Tax=Hemicordylus capensis TaxID=884348 RepID=UPI002302071C|nr:growth/differentiation factor 2 [Hemicordylus capensis]
MSYFGVLALNVIIIHWTSGKPLEDQGRLLVMGNSHKYYGNLKKVEAETHSNFKAFLENLKADFLRSLNLTEIPSHENMKEEPPQFMIDLYNRYTKDKSSSPISNIVRSFSAEDVTSLTSLEINSFQKYILLFNASIPWHEEVTRAELRIHVNCQKEAECFSHLQGNMAIYDVFERDHWEKPKDVKSSLVSKEIQECGWVMFDVSGTVKRWVKAEKTKTTSRLEIAVESHVQGDINCGKLHINAKPDSNHLPLLMVFSNDHSNRIKENHTGLQKMVHERKSVLKNAVTNNTAHKQSTLSVNGIHPPLSRSKRSVEINHCRRTSLHVNFEEIGWKWIIAPQDYEAFECKGGCFFPLTDNVTPTKHAIVQTLVHYKNPKKAAKACCVPTKLDAISMLYKDDAGIPTLKYQYEGMKVAECGCR